MEVGDKWKGGFIVRFIVRRLVYENQGGGGEGSLEGSWGRIGVCLGMCLKCAWGVIGVCLGCDWGVLGE